MSAMGVNTRQEPWGWGMDTSICYRVVSSMRVGNGNCSDRRREKPPPLFVERRFSRSPATAADSCGFEPILLGAFGHPFRKPRIGIDRGCTTDCNFAVALIEERRTL